MKLDSIQLKQLCEQAIFAAKEAGNYISTYNKDKLNVNYKSSESNNKPIGGSSLASKVVTEVDLRSQEIILDILSPTLQQYDLALLTEESTDDKSRFIKDYFWCIDPLDGTLPFIQGNEGYSISIALVAQNGIPVIGVIYDPVKKNLYHAISGSGAFKNSKSWHSSTKQTDSNSRFSLIIDQSFLKHNQFKNIETTINSQLSDQGFKEVKIIATGGAAMNAIWVLEHTPACYLKLPKKENGGGSLWDFAASACIFNEFGAYANNFNGNPLDLNNRESTFMNQEGVLYTSNTWITDFIKQNILLK